MINNRIELTIEDHIAHVKLSRADKMNALDSEMFAAIPMVGEQIRQDKRVRAVVLSGDGGNFCAGLDKSNFTSILGKQGVAIDDKQGVAIDDKQGVAIDDKQGVTIDDEKPAMVLADRTHGMSNALQYVVWMWRELPMPVLAAIEGFALGGGLQIALGADMRYATANSQFSILEMRWGIVPDMGSTQIMRHLVADDVIRELTYTAKIFSAQEAKKWGFITDIVDDPLAHAMKVAEQISLKNPDAIRASKKILESNNYQTAAEGLLMESVEQDKIMGKPNQIEAVMSELQKRKPNFID